MIKKLIYLSLTILFLSCSSDNEDSIENQICKIPIGLQVPNIFDTTADVSWASTGNESVWEIEYGPKDFSIGNGTKVIVQNTQTTIENLNGLTDYDIYVRSVCDQNIFSPPVGPVSFTTKNPCLTPSFIDLQGKTTCLVEFLWDISSATSWEIEYGISGFTLGTGTVEITSNQGRYTLENLLPNTTYDIYIRGNCGSGSFGDYSDPLVVTTDPIGFLGNYRCITSQSEALAPTTFADTFGSNTVVTLNKVSERVRTFNIQYLKDTGLTHAEMEFEFTLECNGNITVTPSQNTNFLCSGTNNVLLGPAQGSPWTYIQDDDTEIEFSFVEFYEGNDGGCGKTPNEVTIKLTKI